MASVVFTLAIPKGVAPTENPAEDEETEKLAATTTDWKYRVVAPEVKQHCATRPNAYEFHQAIKCALPKRLSHLAHDPYASRHESASRWKLRMVRRFVDPLDHAKIIEAVLPNREIEDAIRPGDIVYARVTRRRKIK